MHACASASLRQPIGAHSRLSVGDAGAAVARLRKAHALVSEALAAATAQASELREESLSIGQMMVEAEYGSTARAAKAMSADLSLKSRFGKPVTHGLLTAGHRYASPR